MLKKALRKIIGTKKSNKSSKINSISKLNLKDKTALVRVDFNVPIEKKGRTRKISDNNKIKAVIPTIKYLLQQNCKIVLMSHLGRPKGHVVPELRMNIVAKELKILLPRKKVTKLNNCIGAEIRDRISKMKSKEIVLLENLRFYKEEEENDYAFAHSLANLAEVYINDAFAICHRKHASVSAITKFVPSCAGFLLQTEILNMNRAFRPERPAVWLMGGAKLKKVELLENAFKKADCILIGGALAFSFLKARGISVGHSMVDKDSVRLARQVLMHKNAWKIILPLDFNCAKNISTKAKVIERNFNKIGNDEIGLDIGPKTVELFELYLRKAKTVVWNGPMGYFEISKFAKSSRHLAKVIAEIPVFSICGGGETSAMIKKFKLVKGFTHISTGGGASLAYLSGNKLPGIQALEDNYVTFHRKIFRKKARKKSFHTRLGV
jgi:phosphoglycerate kinase